MLLDPTARNITCITLPSNTEKTFSTFIKTLNDVDIAILEPVSSHCFPYQSEKLEFKMFLRDNINSLWSLLVKKANTSDNSTSAGGDWGVNNRGSCCHPLCVMLALWGMWTSLNIYKKRWEGKCLEPVGSVVCVGIVVLSTGVARGGW